MIKSGEDASRFKLHQLLIRVLGCPPVPAALAELDGESLDGFSCAAITILTNTVDALKAENEKIQKRFTKSEQERKWLTAKLLRAGRVVQPDGTFFLENVPYMLEKVMAALKEENERLRG